VAILAREYKLEKRTTSPNPLSVRIYREPSASEEKVLAARPFQSRSDMLQPFSR
jgi:hypothetical protein